MDAHMRSQDVLIDEAFLADVTKESSFAVMLRLFVIMQVINFLEFVVALVAGMRPGADVPFAEMFL